MLEYQLDYIEQAINFRSVYLYRTDLEESLVKRNMRF